MQALQITQDSQSNRWPSCSGVECAWFRWTSPWATRLQFAMEAVWTRPRFYFWRQSYAHCLAAANLDRLRRGGESLKDRDLKVTARKLGSSCFYNWIIQAFTRRRLKKSATVHWGVMLFRNTHQTCFPFCTSQPDNARLPLSAVGGLQCDLQNVGRETFWQARDGQSVLRDTPVQPGLALPPALCFPGSVNWITCKRAKLPGINSCR